MTKEITNTSEMQQFIMDLQNNESLTLEQKCLLEAQRQILGITTQQMSPTLVDASISNIFEQLRRSLNSRQDKKTKELVRYKCADLICNYVNYLDADLHSKLAGINEDTKKLLSDFGVGFNKNLRDTLLLATASAKAVGKTATTVFDVVLADATIGGLAYLGGQSMRTQTTSIDANGNTTITEGPASPEVAKEQGGLFTRAIEEINSNMGTITENTERYIDDWQKETEKVILHNCFSEERIIERKKLIEKAYDWLNKESYKQKARDFFYGSIEKVIDRLSKYQNLIGKSILLSDLIERYANEIKKYRIDKVFGENTSILSRINPINWGGNAVKKAAKAVDSLKIIRGGVHEKEEQRVARWLKVAEEYMP